MSDAGSTVPGKARFAGYELSTSADFFWRGLAIGVQAGERTSSFLPPLFLLCTDRNTVHFTSHDLIFQMLGVLSPQRV